MEFADSTVNMASSASLCFDRMDFSRHDFSAEIFLLKSRARGHSFEKIRDDLRVLLRIVQNSMIELINKDYADFVNLSSNLVGLAAVINKLKAKTTELSAELSDISARINVSVQLLSDKFDKRRACLEQQRVLRRKIEAYSNAKRLNSLLDLIAQNEENCDELVTHSKRLNFYVDRTMLLCKEKDGKPTDPNFDSFYSLILSKYQSILEKFFVLQMKSSKIVTIKVQRNLSVILESFDCCGRLDAALACFLHEFLDSELRNKFPAKQFSEKQQADDLKQLLLDLTQCKAKYSPFFAQSKFESFICDCLLTYLLNFLDERCSNLLFATDISAFRKAYYAICEFFDQNLSPCTDANNCSKSGSDKAAVTCANAGLIRMIFQKFNVDVYYQLTKKEIIQKLAASFNAAVNDVLMCEAVDHELKVYEHSNTSDSATFLLCGEDEKFNLNVSREVLSMIKLIWSADPSKSGVFLPCLTSKCLELSFIVFNMFEHFIRSLAESLMEPKSTADRTLLASPMTSSVVDPASQTSKQHSTRLLCFMLLQAAADVRLLASLLSDKSASISFLPSTVVTSVSPSSISPALMIASALSQRSDELRVTSCLIIERQVVDSVLAEVSAASALIAEIPRRYRWTRKEAPERASAYVAQMFDHLQRFIIDYRRCKIDEVPGKPVSNILTSILNRCALTYAEQINVMLNDVDKISSSLSKLKRGGASMAKHATNRLNVTSEMTDDEKIRSQLNLDLVEFRQLVDTLKIPDWDPSP